MNIGISRTGGHRAACTRRPSAACLLVLCVLATLVPCAAQAMPPQPPPRYPQVPITGTGLQDHLDAKGQSIDVHTDQSSIQSWDAPRCGVSSYTLQMELSAYPVGLSLGIYDATATEPVLFEVFPTEAGIGWFAVVSFRESPARVIVYLFDELANLKGSTLYLGGNRRAFGFYLRGAGGVLFTEDARNPAGDPQFLSYPATESLAGNWWISAEDIALGAGADGDFDDVILLLEGFVCGLPVQRSSWGAVKARFR